VDFRKLNADNAKDLAEGEFVRLKGVGLTMPPYASDYDIYKTRKDIIAASGVRPFTRHQRRQIATFLNAAGNSPRISFLLTTGDKRPVSVLLPAQYALLNAQSELLTGGETVVGKVIRNLRSADSGKPDLTDRYTDFATLASFRPALRALPQFVIDQRTRAGRETLQQTRARLDLRVEENSYQKVLGEFQSNPLRTRKGLQRALARQTTITAPGLVILPIAIYK
jgi:hypothetical protein